MITTTTRIDDMHIFNWDSIVSTFEYDLLQSRETTYDDGTSKFEGFEGGQLVEVYQSDNLDPITGAAPADGGAKDWSEIYTFYDEDGERAGRETTYDDGTQKFVGYDSGRLVEMYQADNLDPYTGAAPADGGAKAWTEIFTRYDENGTREGRQTTYDDGTLKFENYAAGRLVEVYQLDNVDLFTGEAPADGGAQAWTEIFTRFDENGERESRETTFDDGTQKFESYEDGKLSEIFQTDNIDLFSGEAPADGGAKAWTTRQTTFEDGVIEARETEFDNGVLKIEEFQNGVRSKTTQFDHVEEATGVDYPDNGAKTWTEQTTYYDTAGVITDRETLNDNGTIKLEFYEDGERTTAGFLDVEDTFIWNTKITLYEDGEVAVKATQWDDWDETYLVYEDQMLAARLEHYNDGTLELTEYGADGPVVTYYESYEGLAEEYYELLPQTPTF